MRSKRFLGGVGAETAAELIDDAQKNKKNSQNTVNSKPKETKTKKFNESRYTLLLSCKYNK